MRIQLITIILLFSLTAVVHGSDDKSMKELFMKYDQVMDHKKTELIDEIFSQKFIKASGGKEELISKIKELPTSSEKNKPLAPDISWRKGLKNEIYFAKVKEATVNKNKKDAHETEFMVIKEDGKLKIDGTLGDGN